MDTYVTLNFHILVVIAFPDVYTVTNEIVKFKLTKINFKNCSGANVRSRIISDTEFKQPKFFYSSNLATKIKE